MFVTPVGHRVVVRRHAGVRAGRPVFTDILGELIEAGTDLVIRRDDGSTVIVPRAEVHRMRPVPPGRAEILALEAVAARGWPAPETARLGEWLLRAGEGWTRRANSALLAGAAGLPLPDALDAVKAWYAARGGTPMLAIPLPAMAPVDRLAAERGWSVDVESEVLTAPVRPGAPDPDVRLAPIPDDAWKAGYRAKSVPPVGLRILTAPDTVIFGSLVDGETTAAVGRAVVVDGWVGLSAMEVRPEYRRRGLAGRLLRALLAWGAEYGGTRCYLQVESTNEPALALYRGLGFTRHHRYRNRAWRRDTT